MRKRDSGLVSNTEAKKVLDFAGTMLQSQRQVETGSVCPHNPVNILGNLGPGPPDMV